VISTIQLDAVGLNVKLLINGTMTHDMDLPGARTTGTAILHISSPFSSPADALVSNVKLLSMLNFMEGPLITTATQITRQVMGKVIIPNDFSLSFDLKPNGFRASKASIILLTGNGMDSSQLPSISFLPNTNNLHIRFSGVGYGDSGLTNVLLPTNSTTQVQVNAVGVSIEVLLNGTVTQYMDLPGARTTGHAVLHISDPWWSPANATISNVSLLPISSLTPLLDIENTLINTPTQLVPRRMGKVYIPQNYSLSFEITPKGIIVDHSSVMHFTKNWQDNTYMPTISFWPNSNSLYTQFTGIGYPATGFHYGIPIGFTSRIQYNVVGDKVDLIINGTVCNFMTLPGEPFTGNGYLHISNPWSPPANATISNVKMVPISSLTPLLSLERPVIETPTKISPRPFGKVYVPANFSLSFDITPKGTVYVHGSILHFTGNGKDNSRLPGIWFNPNTNNLHIRFSGDGYSDLGFTNVLLPTNAKTQVQVNAVGVYIEVSLNGTITQSMNLPAARTTGTAILHISSPFSSPADATISNVKMVASNVHLVSITNLTEIMSTQLEASSETVENDSTEILTT
jgi:hypothetical protein